MRIATSQIYKQSLDGILKTQERMVRANTQLTNQTKILSPSDDPAAAAKTLRLTERIELNKQYQSNGVLLNNSLKTSESVLGNVQDVMERVRTLSIQAGNGALSQEDRQAIANELDSTKEELADLFNSKNESGEFIFSGFQSSVKPFVYNGATGKYDYQGDEGEKDIQISPSVSLSTGYSGKETFQNVAARLKTTNAVISAGVATAAETKVANQDVFNAFHTANYDAVTAANNDYSVITAPGAPDSYQIFNNGAPMAPPVTGNYVSGEPINFNGLNITIEGAAGSTVDFTLSPPQKDNLLSTLNNVVSVLSDPTATAYQREEALADTLVNLENASTQVSVSRSRLGGNINVLDSITDSLSDRDIADRAARAEISEVNYAEALTTISREETALQALQSTFGRLTRLSLFDSI